MAATLAGTEAASAALSRLQNDAVYRGRGILEERDPFPGISAIQGRYVARKAIPDGIPTAMI
jgi:hypothetical protein